MKKVLSVILSLCMLFSVATSTFAAYGEHEHQLMKMANAACHYEECTICFELFNVGDHTFKDGKCTVCGHSELVNPFVDVRPDAWYHDEIVEAVRTGIINGKTPTTFKPDDFLTYAEAAKLAACMNQVYTNGKVTLTNGTPWYKPYVDYCKEKGIITKEYEFGRNATRAGYMEIFANALPEEAFKQINNIPDGSILDVKSGATYAHFVYKMYRAGIVTGVDEKHSCNPEATIKRCEVATIISRMMNDNNRVEFEMTGNSDKDEEPKEEAKIEEPGKDNQKAEKWDDPTNIPPENPEVTNKVPTQEVTPDITVLPTVPVDIEKPVINSELTIHKQPEGAEYDAYGKKHELEVQVYGGKAPYTYEWYYYTGNRNTKAKIENGDYAKDADTLLLYADNEVMSVLPNDADETSFRKVYNLPEAVGAPIEAGDVIGTVDYYLAGQLVGTSQLVSHDTVERSLIMFLIGKFQEAFTSLYFRVVVCVTLTLVAIYIFYTIRKIRQHDKIQKVHRGRR